MTRPSLKVLLVALALAACNQSPIVTPVRSFDRPADAALACTIFNPTAAGFDTALGWLGLWEPRPLSACAPLPSAQLDRYFDPNDATHTAYYSPQLRTLVANSARGEVAVVNVPQAILIDLDAKNPGYNFIPVGRLPESIRSSTDGCMAVTANTDSCDLAVVDLTILYNMPFVPNRPGQTRDYADRVVRRIELWAGGVGQGSKAHRLEARPTAIEMSPLIEHSSTAPSCGDATYRAWIALPGCEAVVEAELSLSGDADPVRATITRAIHVGRDGATVLTDPGALHCPAECTSGAVRPGSTDPLAASTSRLPGSQAAPGILAIDTESSTQRLVIGDLWSERVNIVPLDATNNAPGTPRAMTLEAGALGMVRARVSPRTPAGKFLYAVARDGTVHVVDLDREVECETNPDPTEFGAVPPKDPALDARRLGCLALGDPATPRRAAKAIGPGISLPNGALARDVAFVHLDTPIPPEAGVPPYSAQPALLVGDFAWVVGSDGRATVIQIYDACPQPNDPQLSDGVNYTPACATDNVLASRYNAYVSNFGSPFPLELERLSHRLRNGARRFLQPNSVGDSAGTPRIQDPANPVTVTVAGSPAKVGQGFRAPTLEVVSRKTTIPDVDLSSVPGIPTVIDAPDPSSVRAETWSLGWEAVIPGTQRAFGRVCSVGSDECPRGALTDAGASFCARGVQAGDKLELTGCVTHADCLYTQVCAHDLAAPVEVITGLCVDSDTEDSQISRCSTLLRAQRRYRIKAARQGVPLATGDATDVLELSEIYEPEFLPETHGCAVDADCADITVPAPDLVVTRPPLPTSCLADTDGQKRCLRACDPSKFDERALCGKGYLCAETSTSTVPARDYRCMRAPLDVGLFHDCLIQPQRYQVRSGASWTVVGSSSGFLSQLEPDPVTRECASPPVSSELYRLNHPRIPLDAPLCPQQLDPALGIDALSWVGNGGPNACLLTSGDDKLLHFENPLLSFALRMPKNPTGYVPDDDTVVSFVLVGGGFPLGLILGIPGDLAAQAPRSMIVAPDGQTVFIVDEGKGTASSALRGQLLRLVSAVQAVDPAFRVR